VPPAADRHRRYGPLPVMDDAREQARRSEADPLIVPTAQVNILAKATNDTNAILHLSY
jgi:hypothetical protein